MAPPSKRIRKLRTIYGPQQVKHLVQEALQKEDTTTRWEAIKLLRQQGHIHEIAKVYVTLICENESIELSEEDMFQLDDFFLLMTSNSAKEYYAILSKAVAEINTNVKKLGNVVRLLTYMILKVDLVNNSAFTEFLQKDLPLFINERIPQFSGKGMILNLCRTYAYVLEILGQMKGENYFSVQWKNIYKKDLLKSPYMAFLTLLVGEEPVDLEQRMAEAYQMEATDSVFSEKYQLYQLAATHYNCFVEKLDEDYLRCITVLILSEACRKKEMVAMVEKLQKDYIFHSRSKKLSSLIFEAVFTVTSESYLEGDRDSQIGKWIGYASHVLKKDEEGYFHTMIAKFSDLCSTKCVEFTENPSTIEQVLSVMELLKDMTLTNKCYEAIMYFFIVLLSLFAKSSSKLFVSILKTARFYMGHPDHHITIDKPILRFINKFWIPAFCNLHNPKDEICTREFFCETMGYFAHRNIESFDKMRLFKYRSQDSVESNIMRFMIKMKSPVVSRPPGSKPIVVSEASNVFLENEGLYIAMKLGEAYRSVVNNTRREKIPLELELFLMTALAQTKRCDRVQILTKYYDKVQFGFLNNIVRDILLGRVEIPADQFKLIIRRAYAVFSVVCPSFELADYDMNDLTNWVSLTLLYKCDPAVLGAFVHRTKTILLIDLMETYDEMENSSLAAPLAACILNKAMNEAPERLIVCCHQVADLGDKNRDMLIFLSKVVEVAAGSKAEYPLLSLVLCVASTINLPEDDIVGHKNMTNFLVACIKHCPKNLLKNQCALFGTLVTKHFKNAYFAINNGSTSEKDADILRYGCSKLADFLSCNEKPLKRIVSFILSEIIMTAKSMELAFAKLHGICDTHSKALLAVALPPVEKKQYARVSQSLKKAYKPTV